MGYVNMFNGFILGFDKLCDVWLILLIRGRFYLFNGLFEERKSRFVERKRESILIQNFLKILWEFYGDICFIVNIVNLLNKIR